MDDMSAWRPSGWSWLSRWFRTLVVAMLFVTSACSLRDRPWERLNTRELDCRPFQVITVAGLIYRTSSIYGRVFVHSSEEPVSGVKIVLRQLGGNVVVDETTASADGRFVLGVHPDGWYQVETCLEGFDSVVVPVHVVGSARAVSMPLYLHLSA